MPGAVPPGSSPRRPGVLVVGMHRSGTSAVAQALHRIGLDAGDPADAVGADWSNADGHWESQRLLAVNDRLLSAAGVRWDSVPADLVLPAGPEWAQAARQAFRGRGAREPWLWKDPRLCLLLPFWRPVLSSLSGGAEPAAVLCLRNPLEIAASLERRNGLPRTRGLALWECYMAAALDGLRGLPVLVSRYEDFLADSPGWSAQAADFLTEHGLWEAGDDDSVAAAASAARAQLRHHRFVAQDVAQASAVTTGQRALFARTLGLSTADRFPAGPPSAEVPAPRRRMPPGAAGGDHPAIWVAGFPSAYGGADTELDHLLDLFLRFEVEVHLVPLFGASDAMRRSVLERGALIHEYHPGIFGGHVVISFCNGEFLRRLPEIVAAGRPRRVVWFNCMTWTFEAELRAHAEGWIDYFGFESRYQRDCLTPQLEAVAPVKTFSYRPYLNTERIGWNHRDFAGTYRVGRISRDDAAKFAPDTWAIFDRVLVPAQLRKKVYILGHGQNAAARIGSPPPGLDWLTWAPSAVTSTEFFRTVDTLVHKTGGSRESYGRVVVEAYAHGVVPVVEDAFAFPELVVQGETGFRTRSSDEMSHFASVLAFDPKRHEAMARAGRELLERITEPERCFQPWREFL